MEKNYQKNLGFVCLKKFGIEKSIGIGIENIWYGKKRFGFGFVQILGIVTH